MIFLRISTVGLLVLIQYSRSEMLLVTNPPPEKNDYDRGRPAAV